MGRIEIRVLGPLEVLVDGRPVDVGSRLQRCVLAVLAATAGEAITSDRLIVELWGESPPARASHSLQTYVSNLRRTLGSDSIESRHSAYRLTVDPSQIDAVRFRQEVRGSSNESDPPATRAAMTSAISLWRGVEAYQELSDSVALLREEAIGLQEMRLSALERLLESRLQVGEQTEIVSDLRRLITENPFREHLTALLMRALYSLGRQAEALSTYQDLRSRLVEELGIEPSSSLQELEVRILNQTETVPVRRATATKQLPQYLTRFIGRDNDLEQLRELLLGRSLLTITGPAGVGKTRLAIECGQMVHDEYNGKLYFADLATIHSEDDVAKAVLTGIGLDDQSARAPEGVISRFLSEGRALLILDNCDHVVSSAAALALNLTTRNRDLTVVATSQRRLGIAGETVFSLAPLSVDGAKAADSDASLLLIERIKDVDRLFQLRDEDRAVIDEICKRLDGLPLALELAAARLQTLTPLELLEAMQDRFGILTSSGSSDLERHSTLLEAVEWSYSLLEPEARALFERISVLIGPFSMEAARAVAGLDMSRTGLIDLMDQLVKRSLLHRQAEAEISRFRMLETLKAFGQARLEAAGERDVFEERRASYFASVAVEDAERIKSHEHLEAVARITQNLDNMRQAFAWTLGNGRLDLAFDLTRPMWRLVFVGVRHHIHEGRLWRMRLAAEPVDAAIKARLYAEQAFADFLTGDQMSASRLAEESLELSESVGLDQPLALEALALVAATNRETSKATDLAERIIALGGDEHDAHGLEALAMAQIFGGDSAGAVRTVEKVFVEADVTNDPLRRVRGLALMGAALQGVDLERSEHTLDDAVDQTSRFGMDWDLAGAVMARSLTRLMSGNIAGALEDVERSCHLTYNVGDNRRLAQSLEILGSVLARLGRGQEATQMLSAAGNLRATAGVAGSAAEESRRAEALVALETSLVPDEFLQAKNWGQSTSVAEAVDLAKSAAASARDELSSRPASQ